MKDCIIVGVTSSIACFKAVQLVSDLIKKGYDVEVIMSKNATEFVTPLTFSSLTKHKTYVDTFDREVNYEVEHISLADKAKAFILAPASANVIGKIANGICDDMLTTTFLACDCIKIIAPAMNTKMYNNPILQDNLSKCRDYGMNIVEPCSGRLACGAIGKGKLANIDDIIDELEFQLSESFLEGKKILISAGGTREYLDPVRFITNPSSGKQGYALAKIARNLKADVTLVSANVNLSDIRNVNTIKVNTSSEMSDYILKYQNDFDIIIMASAVSDYTPIEYSDEKIKKSDNSLTIQLTKTTDILKTLGSNKKDGQILVGFCMETSNLIENAKKKLVNKNCDYIVANNLKTDGAGFNTDTNVVSILDKDNIYKFNLMSKEDVAYELFKLIKE